jgi:hypothetical protein
MSYSCTCMYVRPEDRATDRSYVRSTVDDQVEEKVP